MISTCPGGMATPHSSQFIPRSSQFHPKLDPKVIPRSSQRHPPTICPGARLNPRTTTRRPELADGFAVSEGPQSRVASPLCPPAICQPLCHRLMGRTPETPNPGYSLFAGALSNSVFTAWRKPLARHIRSIYTERIRNEHVYITSAPRSVQGFFSNSRQACVDKTPLSVLPPFVLPSCPLW